MHWRRKRTLVFRAADEWEPVALAGITAAPAEYLHHAVDSFPIDLPWLETVVEKLDVALQTVEDPSRI